MTLAGTAAQSLTDLRVVVADQSDPPDGEHPIVLALRRVIEVRGGAVAWHSRPQVHGIAEQRDFLLHQATSDGVLHLDDVFLEPWVAEQFVRTLREQACGFVGAFPSGLSHRDDVRPEQQVVELWHGAVQPESLAPEGPGWDRWHLHRAANRYHASRRVSSGETWLYEVAWVASCVIYDHLKLESVCGFAFCRQLPRWHSGEEVMVQNLLQRRYGGCAIMPSGT